MQRLHSICGKKNIVAEKHTRRLNYQITSILLHYHWRILLPGWFCVPLASSLLSSCRPGPARTLSASSYSSCRRRSAPACSTSQSGPTKAQRVRVLTEIHTSIYFVFLILSSCTVNPKVVRLSGMKSSAGPTRPSERLSA